MGQDERGLRPFRPADVAVGRRYAERTLAARSERALALAPPRDLVVDPADPACFATLEEAVGAARDIDRIVVRPGVHEFGRLSLSGRTVNIEGAGQDRTAVVLKGSIHAAKSRVTLRRLTVISPDPLSPILSHEECETVIEDAVIGGRLDPHHWLDSRDRATGAFTAFGGSVTLRRCRIAGEVFASELDPPDLWELVSDPEAIGDRWTIVPPQEVRIEHCGIEGDVFIRAARSVLRATRITNHRALQLWGVEHDALVEDCTFEGEVNVGVARSVLRRVHTMGPHASLTLHLPDLGTKAPHVSVIEDSDITNACHWHSPYADGVDVTIRRSTFDPAPECVRDCGYCGWGDVHGEMVGFDGRGWGDDEQTADIDEPSGVELSDMDVEPF